MLLLKQRAAEHAADRARRTQAEGDAAAKAAAEASDAASKARELEKKAIAKKTALQKAAELAAAKKKESTSTSVVSKPYSGPIPSSCGDYSGNRAIGCALMLDVGFKIDQFPCLDKLFDPGERLEPEGVELRIRGVRHSPGAARQQDGQVRQRLEDQPGDADQVGPRLHPGPVLDALWCVESLGGDRLVLTPFVPPISTTRYALRRVPRCLSADGDQMTTWSGMSWRSWLPSYWR